MCIGTIIAPVRRRRATIAGWSQILGYRPDRQEDSIIKEFFPFVERDVARVARELGMAAANDLELLRAIALRPLPRAGPLGRLPWLRHQPEVGIGAARGAPAPDVGGVGPRRSSRRLLDTRLDRGIQHVVFRAGAPLVQRVLEVLDRLQYREALSAQGARPAAGPGVYLLADNAIRKDGVVGQRSGARLQERVLRLGGVLVERRRGPRGRPPSAVPRSLAVGARRGFPGDRRVRALVEQLLPAHRDQLSGQFAFASPAMSKLGRTRIVPGVEDPHMALPDEQRYDRILGPWLRSHKVVDAKTARPADPMYLQGDPLQRLQRAGHQAPVVLIVVRVKGVV